MVQSAFLCAALVAAHTTVASAFVCAGLTGRISCSSRTAQASSSSVTPTRMAVGSEGNQGQSRGELLQTVWKTALTAGAAQTLLASSALAEDTITTPSGLKIKKLVLGTGPVVEQGDLIGVRFKGNYGNYEFDNIFTTAEPYYMRAGIGTLVKGVEEAILLMKVGDKWQLTCSADLAFGTKGRPPSPGRPRIPPGAEVEYTVELVALPGKEEDIVEKRDGDSFTGNAFDDQ
ncbi:unnamed protein product [Hapterophycus canaliculatus]